MSIIELNATSCQNCYKCIRECPIKSISFNDGKAKIIDEECILCGKCVLQCPQNAKYIRNDVPAVANLIKSGEKVYFSVAPSYRAWFDVSFENLSAAIKKLGAVGVEETAIGANAVSREYENLMTAKDMKNIIVTACSSVVLLVEKKFPQIVKYLAPVSSPMMAHAKLIKEAYGDDVKVVFVGPCFSKKKEAEDVKAGSAVSYAITFYHLDEWLKKSGINYSEIDSGVVGVANSTSRLYPKPSGIIQTINEKKFGSYTPISCDGLENCIEYFQAIAKGEIEGIFLEANICSGGCIGGPNFKAANKSVLESICKISAKNRNRDKNPAKSTTVEVNYPRVFDSAAKGKKKPTEAQIREILLRTGKVKKSDELNCGCCGYSTCREKAEAVYYGKADINMCVPFFRSRAESVSNTVIEHSPNGIIVFDDDECVIDLNPKAGEMFNTSVLECKGKPIPEFFGDNGFEDSRNCGEPVFSTMNMNDGGLIIEKTTTYLPDHKMYIAFLKDVTQDEIQQREMKNMQQTTYETAQRVIEKQMRVAQEIASLLGETTAETKVALKKLVADPDTMQHK